MHSCSSILLSVKYPEPYFVDPIMRTAIEVVKQSFMNLTNMEMEFWTAFPWKILNKGNFLKD